MNRLLKGLLVFGTWFIAHVAATPVDTYPFKTVENQERAISLARSLRCPQCQNQDLVDSNSPVAQDLRLQVYKMVDAGKADDEIIQYMTQRYGEFVLYKPKLENKTYILWWGPLGLLLIGGLVGVIFIRQQRINKGTEPQISESDQKMLDELLKDNNKNE
ncbi:cytochrome c-type biogenesis protein CcmH [Parashewanella spongiae]|uniref:Cytochrome c-type biogenesis protein n=1 Tax=Parashewanella spongiae TaxID=342950 RepID=A0A3A6TPC5_9GAMM|nr:cytochrome c-type biogenesis protein [Parashewanella spongiae]MCL1079912.1 cytochrome c-type biogenesis protein CcmH [Parashewanella spongiae]RJY06420.1 cytochrome c-type biogenesis protein CcmH [Parashewanella spongiae]